MRSVLLPLLALGAFLGAAPPDAPVDPRVRVDEIFREFDRSDVPGCGLGIYRDGKIVYARGYGMANLELGIANTSQTVFDIGSTAKQFSAFAIQLLAREGKLSLDDDVRKWVPEIPSYGKTVTIRQLLHHKRKDARRILGDMGRHLERAQCAAHKDDVVPEILQETHAARAPRFGASIEESLGRDKRRDDVEGVF